MEKSIAALMLATPRILRPYRHKAQAATAISGRDTAHANRAAVANAVLHLLSEWCPLLLYLGHVVRECNWSGGKQRYRVTSSGGVAVEFVSVEEAASRTV